MSAVAKPQLRGLLQSQIKKNIIVALTLTAITGVAWQFGICEPRKLKYAEFYRNYDADKEFERMRAAGVFKNC